MAEVGDKSSNWVVVGELKILRTAEVNLHASKSSSLQRSNKGKKDCRHVIPSLTTRQARFSNTSLYTGRQTNAEAGTVRKARVAVF